MIRQNALKFIKNPVSKIILTWFLVTRICLLIIGGTSQILYSTTFVGFFADENLTKNALVMSPFIRAWGSWDSIYYYRIAEEGYPNIKDSEPNIKTKRRFAFFPLYSILIKFINSLTDLNLYLTGLILSNIFFLFSCILMYKLFCLDYSRATALQAVKFMLLAPTSFVFSGFFTESLYLFLLILSFWFARKGNWLMVGVSGMFTSLSRVPGVLSLFPLAIIAWNKTPLQQINFKEILNKLLPLILIPVGLGLFMLLNYVKTDDPLFFYHVQDTWGRELRNPIISLPLELISAIKTAKINRFVETGATLTAILLLCLGFRRLRLEYQIFSIYSLVVPLLTSTWSMPRYILVIFPLYLCLVFICSKRWQKDLMTIILAMAMGFLMVNWSTGGQLII
jgi:ABC-type multidrug transport system fused ATPase/permease subunit